MAKKRKRSETRPTVSIKKYGGLWIAWNSKLTRVVASGRTVAEVADNAVRAGEPKAVFEKVPSFKKFVLGRWL